MGDLNNFDRVKRDESFQVPFQQWVAGRTEDVLPFLFDSGNREYVSRGLLPSVSMNEGDDALAMDDRKDEKPEKISDNPPDKGGKQTDDAKDKGERLIQSSSRDNRSIDRQVDVRKQKLAPALESMLQGQAASLDLTERISMVATNGDKTEVVRLAKLRDIADLVEAKKWEDFRSYLEPGLARGVRAMSAKIRSGDEKLIEEAEKELASLVKSMPELQFDEEFRNELTASYDRMINDRTAKKLPPLNERLWPTIPKTQRANGDALAEANKIYAQSGAKASRPFFEKAIQDADQLPQDKIGEEREALFLRRLSLDRTIAGMNSKAQSNELYLITEGAKARGDEWEKYLEYLAPGTVRINAGLAMISSGEPELLLYGKQLLGQAIEKRPQLEFSKEYQSNLRKAFESHFKHRFAKEKPVVKSGEKSGEKPVVETPGTKSGAGQVAQDQQALEIGFKQIDPKSLSPEALKELENDAEINSYLADELTGPVLVAALLYLGYKVVKGRLTKARPGSTLPEAKEGPKAVEKEPGAAKKPNIGEEHAPLKREKDLKQEGNEIPPAERIRSGEKGASAPEPRTSRLRTLNGTSMGEPFHLNIGAGREIVVGTEGHVDVGGKFLANRHAAIHVDSDGNAFMRILPEGGPNAVALIERFEQPNKKLTASDGWVIIGTKDKISIGGSKFISLSEQIASPYAVRLDGRNLIIEPGTHVTIGRGDPTANEHADGSKRVNLGEDRRRVSRVHAQIGVDEKGRLFIVDVGTTGKGSSDGTWVNNKYIEPKKRYFIDENDVISLGKAGREGSMAVEVRDVFSHGERVKDGSASAKPVKYTIRMEPRAEVAPAPSVDPVIPRDTRGSYEIGKVGEKQIRILGGLGTELPHESIRLSTVDARALGSDQSPFQKVKLQVRGNDVDYYQSKEHPGRFYILAETGKGGAKLIRDYEVFVDPGRSGEQGRAVEKPGPSPKSEGPDQSKPQKKPDVPDKPEDPVKQKDSEKPAAPAKQEDLEKPTEPAQPVGTEKPGEQANLAKILEEGSVLKDGKPLSTELLEKAVRDSWRKLYGNDIPSTSADVSLKKLQIAIEEALIELKCEKSLKESPAIARALAQPESPLFQPDSVSQKLQAQPESRLFTGQDRSTNDSTSGAQRSTRLLALDRESIRNRIILESKPEVVAEKWLELSKYELEQNRKMGRITDEAFASEAKRYKQFEERINKLAVKERAGLGSKMKSLVEKGSKAVPWLILGNFALDRLAD